MVSYTLPAGSVIFLMLAVVAHPADADVARGGQLARQWCANCHVVDEHPSSVVQQGPPSFRTIAHHLTADEIHAFLTHPHGAMPDLALTRSEIDDLIGYIETLR